MKKKRLFTVPMVCVAMLLFFIGVGSIYALTSDGSFDAAQNQAGVGEDLSTPLERLVQSVRYDFTNTFKSTVDDESSEIMITKRLAGEDITAEDSEKSFTFETVLTGLVPGNRYIVVRPEDDEMDPPSSAYRTADPNGSLTVTETLKAGETLIIKGVPHGAHYTVKEKMRSVDADFDFDARYEVTMGEEDTTVDGGVVDKTAQQLSSATETMGELTVEYTFTNSKSRPHDLSFVKQLKVDGITSSRTINFPFTIAFSGMEPQTTYTSDDGETSFTTDAAGKAVLETELTTGQALTFSDVPGTTVYNVVEAPAAYLPTITVTDTSTTDEIASETGVWGEGIEYTSSAEGMAQDQTVTVVNAENTANDLTITKEISGSDADVTEEFTITVEFTGLAPNTQYTISAIGASSTTMTSNSNGAASKALTVSDGTSYTFTDIPNTARFMITESGKAGYVPSFSVETDGGIDAIARGGEEGEDLSLPAQEKLVTDTVYNFVNTKDITPPVKTVSDSDNITLNGTGEEIDVTENTVESVTSKWDYKITQEAPAGIESFTLVDTLPPYILTELTTQADFNSVHAKLITKGPNQEPITYEGTMTESDGVYSNDAFDITLDDSDVRAALTITAHDSLLGPSFNGGTVELSFTAYLPNMPDEVTMDDLRAAGCVKAGGKRLQFVNEAATFINEWEFHTEEVKTNILMDNGLTIRKNVIGELGDKSKPFDFTMRLTDLEPGGTYSYATPQSVTISAEYGKETGTDRPIVTFTAVDSNGDPVKNIELGIYEVTEDSGNELVGTAKTGNDGTVTVAIPEGDYIVSVCGVECDLAFEEENFRFLSTTVLTDADRTYFTADEDGNATVNFTLTHDQSLTFDDLAFGATYNITEAESDYLASYETTQGAAFVTRPSRTNPEAGMSLSTGTNVYQANKAVTIVYGNEVETEPVLINKQDADTSDALSGAMLSVTTVDDPDTVIDSWESAAAPHEVELVAGQTYVLTEDDAPQGYEVAEPITFRVRMNDGDAIIEVDDGGDWEPVQDSTVVMKDIKAPAEPITIEKIDPDTENYITGATLAIEDSSGTTVETWTTSSTVKTVTLVPGDYVLKETAAPDGYAPASPIPFTIESDGSVTSNVSGAVVGGKLVMYDGPGRDIVVTKTVTGNNADMTKTFTFTATFTGLAPNATYRVTGDDAKTFTADASGCGSVTFNLGNSDSATIKNLPIGAGYQVSENPEGYESTHRHNGVTESTAASTGTITSANSAISIDYTNNLDVPVPTGIPGKGIAAGLIGFTALLAALLAYINRRKLFAPK